MRVPIIAACAALASASPLWAATYHISPDGSGDFPTIQAAIDAAASGDEIVLSDGTFTGDGNWDLDFGTKELVLRSENGYEATTIDCGFDNIHDIFHRGVIIEGGQTSATQIEGITFEHSAGPMDGGSIRCVGASPVLRNLRIQGNRIWGRGAGVFVQSGAPRIEDCVFPGGLDTGEGSAIFAEQSWVSVQRCYVAEDGYGVIDVDGGTVEDCLFAHVQGPWEYQGVAILARGGHVSVLRCTFFHTFGSAVSVRASAEAVIGSCVFDYNIGDSGPGVSSAGNTTIRDTKFLRGQAGFFGSAVDAYGGTLLMDHCVLFDNHAFGYSELNGAVVIGGASATISHCTFAMSRGSQRGSSIEIWQGGRVAVDHSIVAFGGPSPSGGGAVYCHGTPGALDVACTDIYGNEGGDWTGCVAGMETTNGNLSADPLFCDVAAGDLSLHGDSPCAPANSGECGLIGALGPWCGPLAVEPHSWGSIKALYR